MPSYNSRDVDVIFGGLRLSGWAPDTFCDIEYENDSWSLTIGADGEGIRSRSNDLSAKVTLRLLPSSDANTKLHAQWMADQASGRATVPLVILHVPDGTSHTSDGCWVMKPPKKTYAAKSEPLEWVIQAYRLFPTYGFSTEKP